MSLEPVAFRSGSIDPVACLAESWGRVRVRYGILLLITVAGVLIGSVLPMGILLGPLMCGIYTCYIDQWQGRPVRFERVFVGFESGLLMESLIATMVMVVVSMVVVVPLMLVVMAFVVFLGLTSASHHGSGAPVTLIVALFLGGVVLVLVVATVIGTFFSFTYPLIVDRRMSGLEALRLSARAAWANIWGLLGLGLANLALGVGGVLCCYVGAFLVMPVTFGALMAAYVKVFGLTEQRLGTNEV